MKAQTRIALACLAVVVAAGCSKGKVQDYRGAGLPADTILLNDQVLVYRAMLWASFPMDDPSLIILADPLLLPRSEGLFGGDAMPSEVLSAMKAMGVVKGTCQLPVRATAVPLACPAERPGYVVRFSEPFRLGRDSLQVHLAAQNYTVTNGPKIERIRFERAYYLVRTPTGWRAVREARMPAP